MRAFFPVLSILLFSMNSFAAIPKKATVFIEKAEVKPFSETLSYPGRVKSRINATVLSEVDGEIVRITKVLGSKVKKNDVVMIVQNTDPVFRYAPQKVRSPGDGYLTSVVSSLMSKVQRGQTLFTVSDPSNLLIEVEVPANDLSFLNIGAKGSYRPDPLSPETIDVVIEGLSPVVDLKTGTASAELKPIAKVKAEKVTSLRQGQLGQASFKINERQSILIPETAVTFKEDKPYVRVLDKGKVQRKLVELGQRRGDSFEVKSGLQAQEQFVVRTSRFVSDGEDVDVQAPENKEGQKEKL